MVELYPAASSRSWLLNHRGYKQRASTRALGRLVDSLLDDAPWLDTRAFEQVMRRSHDAFDAVVAAMMACAAARGVTFQPPEDDLAAARTEGWIAIPREPISALL